MARFIDSFSSGILLMLSGITVGQAIAATTDFTATVMDGHCQVAIDTPTLRFDRHNTTEFSDGTAQILPLDVSVNCEGMKGQAPSMTVSGESSQLTDKRLFRAGNSSASYVGFMLKKGTLNNLKDFYNAAGTVAPGDTVAIAQDDGGSVQPFSVGLVRSAGDPPLTAGAVNANITFAFIFP